MTGRTSSGHHRPEPRTLCRDPLHLLALGLGTGLAPRAPGTAGTLVGVGLYLALPPMPLWAYAVVVVACFAAGVWLCERTARALGVHDHPAIVWDEVVGYLITMAGAPAGWPWVVAGFALFRLFDVVKPWPVSLADRHVHGGFGIMLDDVLAGLYGLAALQLLTAVWAAGGLPGL